jgi:hypothetical protein
MKTTTIKPALTGEKKILKQAGDLMHRYALLNQSRKDLLDSIMEELKGYEKEMKETEVKLIEIGEKNKLMFNADGNLAFDDGYLHITKNTVVITKKKFDMATFAASQPEMIDIKFRTNPIKKAFLDKDLRKNLTALGVDIDTVEKVEVKVGKNLEGR